MGAPGALRISPVQWAQTLKAPWPRVHRLLAAGTFLFGEKFSAEFRGRSFMELTTTSFGKERQELFASGW
jgi:hypothetical protein